MIPSPPAGVWYLGPFPLRAYALAIILGILAAIVITNRRWVARGGSPGVAADVAVWVVPFGIVGGRLYHLVTSPAAYFGPGGDPVDAVKVWEGGLGIWGAVLLGGVGAWIACRRRGIALPPFADALAPGLAVAQAIGRFGNYANQELFGRPTDLPWGLQIDPQHRPAAYADAETFHPTFLYESLWCLGVAALVWWVDRRRRLGHGRAFALYVAAYCVGRFWIEGLRVDAAQQVLGLRLNEWTSMVVFLGALAYLLVSARLRPGRESVVEPRRPSPAAAAGESGHIAPDGQAAALGGPHDERGRKEAP